jgi:hypothetical protein
MPYQPPPGYPGPPVGPPPVPAKPRPSAAWFAVGAVLMLVAVVLFGVQVARAVHTVGHRDAELSGRGVHHVRLPSGVRRAVFVKGRFRCRAVDSAGIPVHFDRPDGKATFGDWRLVATFDTGDGRLTLRCTGPGTARIIGVPSGSTVASLVVLGLLLPFVLGVAGFVVLLITAILWFSRRPTASPTAAWPPPR